MFEQNPTDRGFRAIKYLFKCYTIGNAPANNDFLKKKSIYMYYVQYIDDNTIY